MEITTTIGTETKQVEINIRYKIEEMFRRDRSLDAMEAQECVLVDKVLGEPETGYHLGYQIHPPIPRYKKQERGKL